jgi:D-arabinose 5-phosphate isomerase GutQ
VVLTGMGKSGIIAQKIAATLSSTGSPALFLHPAEAVHGDLGVLMPGDVVVALSASGETEEILRLLALLKRKGDALISFCCNLNSTLAAASDVALDCGVEREACGLNLAPTASTTVMLALGDALAIAVSLRKGFRAEDFAELHPGGKLGKRLAKVRDLMHSGDEVPVVAPSTLDDRRDLRNVLEEAGHYHRAGAGPTARRHQRRRPAAIVGARRRRGPQPYRRRGHEPPSPHHRRHRTRRHGAGDSGRAQDHVAGGRGCRSRRSRACCICTICGAWK